jgi:trehalose 6-phosphate phosphatase
MAHAAATGTGVLMQIDQHRLNGDFTPDLRASAILLDVDGTIVDIAPTPDAVVVPSSLRAALARLVEHTDGAVALVSGRALADLDRLFAPLRLAAVGVHGAELRPLGGTPRAVRSPPRLDDALRRRLAALAGGGVVLEDKGYSIALHYRAAPERAAQVRAAVDAICAEPRPAQLEILPGKAVVEIKPAGFSKATGVRALMTHPPFAGRRPIFIGDDTTDESVFAIMPDLAGTAFVVGREVDGVAGSFATPAGVRAWLDRIARVGESVTR